MCCTTLFSGPVSSEKLEPCGPWKAGERSSPPSHSFAAKTKPSYLQTPIDFREVKFVGKGSPVYPFLGLLSLLLVAGFMDCLRAVPGGTATAVRRLSDNLRAVGYNEAFMINGNPVIKNLRVAVYNTAELNN